MTDNITNDSLANYFEKNYKWSGIVINKIESLEKQFEKFNLPSTITLLEITNDFEFLLNLNRPVMKTISCYPMNITFIYSKILFDENIKNTISINYSKIDTTFGELYVNNNFKQFTHFI
jgi:hypothetical protein